MKHFCWKEPYRHSNSFPSCYRQETETTRGEISSWIQDDLYRYNCYKETHDPLSYVSVPGFTFTTTYLTLFSWISLVCPRRWDFHQGRCFFLSAFEKSWNKSKDYCETEESTLAIVNTPEKLVRALEGYSEAVHPTSASVGGDGRATGLVEQGRGGGERWRGGWLRAQALCSESENGRLFSLAVGMFLKSIWVSEIHTLWFLSWGTAVDQQPRDGPVHLKCREWSDELMFKSCLRTTHIDVSW